jgi:hypothetical protein
VLPPSGGDRRRDGEGERAGELPSTAVQRPGDAEKVASCSSPPQKSETSMAGSVNNSPGRWGLPSTSRSTRTRRRMESRVSMPAFWMLSRIGSICSGAISRMARPAFACTTMPVTWWATKSCRSRASSSRFPYRTACTRRALRVSRTRR